MNNPIRNPYNNIPLYQSPLNELLHYSYVNINECKATVQGNRQQYPIKNHFCRYFSGTSYCLEKGENMREWPEGIFF
jgi:hypothetical protein